MSPKKLSQTKDVERSMDTLGLIRTVIFDLMHCLCNLEQRNDHERLEKLLSDFHAKISEPQIDALYHKVGFSHVKKIGGELKKVLRDHRAGKITDEQFSLFVKSIFSGALPKDELDHMVKSFLSVKGKSINKGTTSTRIYRSLDEEAMAKFLAVSSGTVSNHKKNVDRPFQVRFASDNLAEILAELFDIPEPNALRIARTVKVELEKSSKPLFDNEAKDVTDEAELDEMAGAAKKIILDEMKSRLKLNKAELKNKRIRK